MNYLFTTEISETWDKKTLNKLKLTQSMPKLIFIWRDQIATVHYLQFHKDYNLWNFSEEWLTSAVEGEKKVN